MRYSKEEMFGIQFDSPNMNLILNFFPLGTFSFGETHFIHQRDNVKHPWLKLSFEILDLIIDSMVKKMIMAVK